MLDLTFGEQVKLVLSRKGMTIKELAEIIEKRTGKKMSRQNLTQRLGRDNFQEQDMRMIAEILECPFRLSILSESEAVEGTQNEEKENAQPKPASKTTKESVRIAKAKARREKKAREAERLADAIEQVPSEMRREPVEKEMTLGDYIDIHEELVRQETARLPKVSDEEQAVEAEASESSVFDGDTAEIPKDIDIVEKEKKEASAGEVQEEGMSQEEAELEGIRQEEESEQEEAGQEDTAQEELPPEETEVESGEYVQPEVDVEELLREMEELEKERRLLEKQVKEAKEAKEARAQEEQAYEEKKITGWRAMFQRRTKKERQEELQEEAKIVEQVILREPTMEELEDEYIEYDEPETGAEEESELSEGNEEQLDPDEILEELLEEEEDVEDLTRGERNPYTGHEYETNSVRMHPKRIGYVQLYDRRDHGWTDMTEWAFLGYQERKKALLGKDYDPPIYLD